MRYFEYNEQSSLNILADTLAIASFDSKTGEIAGSKRTSMSGERTYYRPVANEFGTTYKDVLTFELSLIKCNGYPITVDEQIKIERWLTSPKLSKWMVFKDTTTDNEVHYYGKVVETNWVVYGAGYAGVTIEFETNAPYPWIPVKEEYKKQGGVFYRKNGDGWTSMTSGSLTFSCDSDELEETIYPKITFNNPNEKANFTVTNVTDKSNKLTMSLYRNLSVLMDCKNNILKDTVTTGIVDYKDIGWDNIENIYWPQIYPGNNTWTVSGGDLEITIEYLMPYKRVGGWW